MLETDDHNKHHGKKLAKIAKSENTRKDTDKPQLTQSNIYSTNDLFLNSVGLADNIASSTLQHTSPHLSFPKALRFQSQSNLNAPTNLELPSQLQTRTTTQGFGNKILYQFKWQEIKAQTMPSPDRYKVQQEPGQDKLKRSFGIPFHYYSHTFLPYNRYLPDQVAKAMPGPGEYNVRKDLAQHRYQFQLKGKGRMSNDFRDWGFPGPQAYTPGFKLTSPSRFTKISQGIGKKPNPFESKSQTPGPGRYNLPSKFDKFTKKSSLAKVEVS